MYMKENIGMKTPNVHKVYIGYKLMADCYFSFCISTHFKISFFTCVLYHN